MRTLAERGLYSGGTLQAIDGKGRVAIPALLRSALERNCADRFIVIAAHDKSPCLSVYDRGWQCLLDARLDRDEERALNEDRDFDRDNIARRTFGAVDEAPYDISGRFILPPFFRARAQLQDFAFFAGVRHTIEIWNPHILIETTDADPVLKDMAAFELKQRGAA